MDGGCGCGSWVACWLQTAEPPGPFLPAFGASSWNCAPFSYSVRLDAYTAFANHYESVAPLHILPRRTRVAAALVGRSSALPRVVANGSNSFATVGGEFELAGRGSGTTHGIAHGHTSPASQNRPSLSPDNKTNSTPRPSLGRVSSLSSYLVGLAWIQWLFV